MRAKNFRWLLSVFVFCFVAACSQNDEQRAFENKAYSTSKDYTRTNPTNGEVIENDPDDWRVSPFYQGLVSIKPAFPNPASTSDNITINFNNHGIETVSGLFVLAYYNSTGGYSYLDEYRGHLQVGPTIINFQGGHVVQFPENPQGLYRVIILDGNENVISYGDVQVDQ
ncbi:MAG: hypothetical protein WEA56_11670 [Balneolaceae bacterium]